MSTAVLAQNATTLAATGFNLDAPDNSRIRGIVRAAAATKQGGFMFQPGVLFTKVCKEIRSLAGLNKGAHLPDKVARLIQQEVNNLPVTELAQLQTDGYTLLKQSASKVVVKVKDLTCTRQKAQTYEKITSLEDREKDMSWTIFQLKEKRDKLSATTEFRDREHRAKVENMIESLNSKIETYSKIHKVLKMEIEEQRKVTAPAKEPEVKK